MIFISGLDFLKYLTERLTSQIGKKPTDKPKSYKYNEPTGYTNQWFGIIPFAIKTFLKNNKSR